MLPSMKPKVTWAWGPKALVAVFIFAACEGKRMNEEELLGEYKLTLPRFTGTLELQDNGTFAQSFDLSSGKRLQAEGRWKYQPPVSGAANAGTVLIYGPILVIDEKLHQKEVSFTLSMPVFSDWKKISLYLDPDGSYAYEKPN